MPYILPEQIKELQKIDLLTYLQNYEPNELVHVSGNNYCTRSHDSLKISNGLWNWFSKGIGGKNAIDYLIKVKNYTFLEAVELLSNGNVKTIPFSVSNEPKIQQKNEIKIPKKSYNFNIAKEYLINRGIAESIIDECYKNNLIYQEENTNNVVFVGYDDSNNIRYAGCRATNETRYMRDATGSDKKYSFRLLSQVPNNTIHVFESSIDLLSYATLLEYKGIDYKKENLIALAGVYQPAKCIENSKIPIAIDKYLKEHQNVKNIVLHFDRDIAGRNATKAFQIVIPKDYIVVDCPVPYGKDVNDFLCYKLGLKNTNEITNYKTTKEQFRD
jgi:hypothetical protein